MGMEEYDSEGRFVRADYGDLSVVSVYPVSYTHLDVYKRQGYGECQLYILSVGGRDVGARCVNRFREAAQIG